MTSLFLAPADPNATPATLSPELAALSLQEATALSFSEAQGVVEPYVRPEGVDPDAVRVLVFSHAPAPRGRAVGR